MGTSLHLFRIQLALVLFGATLGYRLPKSIVPNEYVLEIVTNLGQEEDRFDFHGKVQINVTCVSPTNSITLHSKNLTISKHKVAVRSLSPDNADPLNVTDVSLVTKDDFLVIQLKEELKPKKTYLVEIEFRAALEEVLAGYYRSYYINKKGEKQWLAVTQFEPIDARRAFPCFDEPAFKAKFTISLGRHQRYTSMSNMPIAMTENMKDMPDWEWDRYETTVPMSTYLVAFAVTDFEHVTSPQFENNVTFRVWARKEAVDQLDFAREIGPKFLRFYEKYFEIDYPLPKQDMIAIPDFSAGAMENWGLITYRETYLLFDPQQSPFIVKESIASVVAHELAHQWFGNLVTMKWWTDLWLNEGFATYMAAITVENVFPEWKSLRDDTVTNLLSVFNFDWLKTSHPVSVPIGHPKEIQEIFDIISYKKGSYLLHMMSNFLGPEVLRKGVSNYLKIHMYKNAEKDDLWRSITDEAHRTGALPSNLTVKLVMDDWALKTGFPLLTVTRDYKLGTLTVKQERFFKDRELVGSESTKWWVPLTYTTESDMAFNDTKAKKWLPPDADSLTIEGFPVSPKWVIFNIQGSVLYRVNYDEKNWNLLIDYLKGDDFEGIPILNRVLLIDDAANLASVGLLDYKIFFDVIGYLQQEKEFLPWKTALRNINILDSLLMRTPIYKSFTEYIRTIVQPIYEEVGGFQHRDPEKDQLETVRHRVQITQTACKFGIERCVAKAIELFRNLQHGNITKEDIPNDLRGVVYCNGIKHGGEAEWSYLWKLYTTSNVADIKNVILAALGCSRQPALLQQYLTRAVLNDSSIRKQDIVTVFIPVLSHEIGWQVGKDFITNNVKTIYDRINPSISKFTSILSSLSRGIIHADELDWFQNLTETHKDSFREIKNGVKQALESAKLNIQWHNKNYDSLQEHLTRT